MSDRPSIEDGVIASGVAVDPWEVPSVIDALAAANLPLVDRERGIAVIRLDPELAEELATIQRTRPNVQNGWEGRALRRAARIIGWEQSDDG